MILVDSSFWIAQLLERDAHHDEALVLAATTSAATLVTTNLILGESWTYLRRRAGHRLAMQWLDRVLSTVAARVEDVTAPLVDEAWAWLRSHDERPYSFVDGTSFAVMRKLRITEALAFDGDFTAAGFTELRPAR